MLQDQPPQYVFASNPGDRNAAGRTFLKDIPATPQFLDLQPTAGPANGQRGRYSALVSVTYLVRCCEMFTARLIVAFMLGCSTYSSFLVPYGLALRHTITATPGMALPTVRLAVNSTPLCASSREICQRYQHTACLLSTCAHGVFAQVASSGCCGHQLKRSIQSDPFWTTCAMSSLTWSRVKGR